MSLVAEEGITLNFRAALYPWLGECYIYSNYLVLIIGLWAIKDKDSVEPLQFVSILISTVI